MVKHKLILSIDKEIVNQAKEYNINFSSFLEIHLSDYLSNTENGRGEIRTRDCVNSYKNHTNDSLKYTF